MTPLTWLDRLLWLLSPLRWVQCKAEFPLWEVEGCEYCIRNKGHPGKHRTYRGQEFLQARARGKQ